MYGALWRRLRGPWYLKLLQALVLFLVVVAVLFLWVFPTVTPYLPIDDGGSIDGGNVSPTAPATPGGTP